MNTKNIKGICFDLDQTLCNSEDYLYSSKRNLKNFTNTAEWQVYRFLKPYLKIVSWEKFIDTYSLSKKEVKKLIPDSAASHSRYLYLQRTLENLDMRFNPDLVYRANTIYWDYVIDNMKLFPSVLEVLRTLKEHHFKICIVTDLTADIQNRKLQKLNIERYIDYMVTSEEAGKDKPNTKELTLALKKMDLKKEEVIMIGNNPKTDIQLAKNSGIGSILFDFGKVHKKEDRNNPDFYITKFSNILKILKVEERTYSKEKLVVFDMVGTLTTQPHLISVILGNILVNKDVKDIKKEYELYKVNKISNEEFWKRIGVKNSKEVEERFFKKITLREGATGVLKDLRKGYKLAILSNIPKEWGAFLSKKFEFEKYFDEIVFSGDYGIKKPHPEIYKLLLNRFPKINPSNIYFVDDDLGDLESGKNLLMQTIWIRSDQDKETFIPDYDVYRLSDIKKILDK